MRGCHSPRIGWITAAGSSRPQSTRIVQRKRWPTSNVDSMMVLRARRGGTGSKYVTFRGGLRRAIPYPPPRQVKRGAQDAQPVYGRKRSWRHVYCVDDLELRPHISAHRSAGVT